MAIFQSIALEIFPIFLEKYFRCVRNISPLQTKKFRSMQNSFCIQEIKIHISVCLEYVWGERRGSEKTSGGGGYWSLYTLGAVVRYPSKFIGI